MEDHILDKHASPDENNKFICDDCNYETEDKHSYGNHYKNNHRHNLQYQMLTRRREYKTSVVT